MKLVPAVVLSLAAWLPLSASVANYGPTSQNLTLTGLGATAGGLGQVRVTWGTCVFDGTTSVCTLSAPFTGVGVGGTASFVLTYSGNGPSPLIFVQQSPGGEFLAFGSLSQGFFRTTLTESNGVTLTFNTLPFFLYGEPGTRPQQCTVVASCTIGQVSLNAGSTITGNITGSFDPTPVIRASLGVISAGAYGGFNAIAPATWIEIYGFNLATNLLPREWGGNDFNGNSAPTTLGGTTVTIAGQKAFVRYVSPTQVNAQVPSNVDPGQQPVVVTTEGGSSAPYSVQVNPIQPGLLAPPVFQVGGRQYVVALYPDGVTFVLPACVSNAVPT